MNFGEKIKAEIESHKTAIASLEAQLAAGESWLGKECDALWGWIGHLFSHPSTAQAAATVAAAAPVATVSSATTTPAAPSA